MKKILLILFGIISSTFAITQYLRKEIVTSDVVIDPYDGRVPDDVDGNYI